MNTKAMKQKILDLAIHGKLVAQNPDDESASVLLEKIRAEKAKLVAETKMKADKKDSFIFVGDDDRHYEKFADGTVKDIEDEIPFELPEGWVWCRLGEIFFHTTGKSLKKTNDKGTLRKYITTSNLYWNSFDFTEVREMYFTDEELEKCTIKKGDLVLCNGGDVGRAAIWNYDEEICYQNHVSRLRPKINGINNKLYLYLLMLYKELGMLSGKGIGITSLSANDLLSVLIPLPPLSEQQRIVSAIQSIFSKIDTLEQNKSDLQTAIKQAKSKILDLAIHGKLVAQDSNDESASELLEKIRAEKAKLVAEKKMKADKKDSFIFVGDDDRHYEKFADGTEKDIEDEIPFELPEGWAWCRLGEICSKLVDGDHNPPKGVSEKTEYLMISSRNINHNQVEDLENVRYLTKDIFDIENKRTNLQVGDILFTSVGSLGRSCVYNGGMNLCFQRSVTIIHTNQYNYWIKYYFDSDYYQDYILDNATGTAQLGFYLQQMEKSFIPLPPLAEQKRIAWKIEALFARLEAIADELAV